MITSLVVARMLTTSREMLLCTEDVGEGAVGEEAMRSVIKGRIPQWGLGGGKEGLRIVVQGSCPKRERRVERVVIILLKVRAQWRVGRTGAGGVLVACFIPLRSCRCPHL